jgi:hypothetical protein
MDAPARSIKGAHMKARLFQMFTVLAMFAVSYDGLFSGITGVKW